MSTRIRTFVGNPADKSNPVMDKKIQEFLDLIRKQDEKIKTLVDASSGSQRILELEKLLDHCRQREKAAQTAPGGDPVALRIRVAELEQDLHKLQASSAAAGSQNVTFGVGGMATPSPDLDTMAAFTRVKESIKSWSQNWAVPTGTTLNPRHPKKKVFDGYLNDISTKRIPSDWAQGDLRWVNLSAVLALHICRNVYDQPFAGIAGLVHGQAGGNWVFNYVYNQYEEVDKTAANIWRCRLINAIDPPEPAPHSTDQRLLDAYRRSMARKSEAAINLAKDFVNEPGGYMLKELEKPEDIDERNKQLQEIYIEALELSSTCWRQVRRPCCVYPPNLPDLKFDSTNPHIELHELHKIRRADSEVNRLALNGKGFSISVHPQIIAWGNNDVGSDGKLLNPDFSKIGAEYAPD